MTVTRSCGWTFRHTRTALRAPGSNSSNSVVFTSESYLRLIYHAPDHGLDILPRGLIGAELPIGACAVLEDPSDVLDLLPAVQLVHDVVHEIEVFEDEVALGDLALEPEVDEHSVDAVAGGAPLVLHQQRAAVLAPALVPRMQPVELDDGGLREGGEGDRLVHTHRDVADPELESAVKRMRPDVPPGLLGVVDAAGADEQVDEVLVVGPRRERVGDVGPREAIEDLAPVRLQARVHADPERRVRGEREQMRQEIAELIHQVNQGLAI